MLPGDTVALSIRSAIFISMPRLSPKPSGRDVKPNSRQNIYNRYKRLPGAILGLAALNPPSRKLVSDSHDSLWPPMVNGRIRPDSRTSFLTPDRPLEGLRKL